ncbi:MAG: DUF692 family protein [Phycisphaerales bacterium]|nr:DUF692 family protein [Phycisphaerales bacterium]
MAASSPPWVGLALMPDPVFLELLEPACREDVDAFEVAPETTWRAGDDGGWQPNGFHRAYAALGARTGKPFVAHAVNGNLGGADPRDERRQQQWLERIAADRATFGYQWLTDHLGACVLGDDAVALPIALPMDDTAAALVRERLVRWQQIAPDTGFENSVFYFLLGDWLAEPAFFARILTAPRTHLLLDLHNVHTMASNVGADPFEYLRRLDLDRVIEIHLSGGACSNPSWLPGGRTLRLDSHDAAVPEAVWRLFEFAAPRCRNLRMATLERMEGTVGPDDVAGVRGELRRIREVLHAGR